jgi:DnaD/phage-associated family protein
MKTLTLKNKSQTNATLVSNDFIDYFMPRANGEFIKVYLFLLRHMDDASATLSVGQIADCLNNTEGDILRAFRFWEKEGWLTMDTDADGSVTSVCLQQNPVSASTPAPSSKTSEILRAPSPKAIPLDSFRNQKEQRDLKNLCMIAEQYLGKTLSVTDIESIHYFYRELHLSADIIEYLLASCVESGHKSLHYIKAVALSWSQAGISSVEEARQLSAVYNKDSYAVLKAFGIHGRSPAPAEQEYIEKWRKEYGFSIDIITEACNRTIAVTHQPRFEYADKILQKWVANDIHHLEDIARLDQDFQKEHARHASTAVRNSSSAAKSSSNKLSNFERRSYDMDSLEEQLLKTN